MTAVVTHVDPLTEAEAEEKRARRLRREGNDAEAIKAYENARELYADTGLQYGNDDVMRSIKRCDAIVSNLRHPKEKREAAITARPNCLACDKPLRRYKYDGKTFGDGTPREWGDYGDNRFCGLRCGWDWACSHAPMQPKPSKGKR